MVGHHFTVMQSHAWDSSKTICMQSSVLGIFLCNYVEKSTGLLVPGELGHSVLQKISNGFSTHRPTTYPRERSSPKQSGGLLFWQKREGRDGAGWKCTPNADHTSSIAGDFQQINLSWLSATWTHALSKARFSTDERAGGGSGNRRPSVVFPSVAAAGSTVQQRETASGVSIRWA